MDTLNRLIDAARKHCEPPTLTELQERLKVSRQTLYDWRGAEHSISDEHLARLIELAQANPDEALAVRKERARSDHERNLWRSLQRRLGHAAGFALCAIALTATLGDSTAYAAGFRALPIMFLFVMLTLRVARSINPTTPTEHPA